MGRSKYTRYLEDVFAGRIPGSELAPPWWDNDRGVWYGPNGDVDGPEDDHVRAQYDKAWKRFKLRGFWRGSDHGVDDHSFKDQALALKNARYDTALLNRYIASHGLPKRQTEIVTLLNQGLSLYAVAKRLKMTASNVTRSLRRLTKAAKRWSGQ